MRRSLAATPSPRRSRCSPGFAGGGGPGAVSGRLPVRGSCSSGGGARKDLVALAHADAQRDPLLGSYVRKPFAGRWYHGQVINVDADVRTGELAYHIAYEDGDEEHLTGQQVRAHLLRGSGSSTPAAFGAGAVSSLASHGATPRPQPQKSLCETLLQSLGPCGVFAVSSALLLAVVWVTPRCWQCAMGAGALDQFVGTRGLATSMWLEHSPYLEQLNRGVATAGVALGGQKVMWPEYVSPLPREAHLSTSIAADSATYSRETKPSTPYSAGGAGHDISTKVSSPLPREAHLSTSIAAGSATYSRETKPAPLFAGNDAGIVVAPSRQGAPTAFASSTSSVPPRPETLTADVMTPSPKLTGAEAMRALSKGVEDSLFSVRQVCGNVFEAAVSYDTNSDSAPFVVLLASGVAIILASMCCGCTKCPLASAGGSGGCGGAMSADAAVILPGAALVDSQGNASGDSPFLRGGPKPEAGTQVQTIPLTGSGLISPVRVASDDGLPMLPFAPTPGSFPDPIKRPSVPGAVVGPTSTSIPLQAGAYYVARVAGEDTVVRLMYYMPSEDAAEVQICRSVQDRRGQVFHKATKPQTGVVSVPIASMRAGPFQLMGGGRAPPHIDELLGHHRVQQKAKDLQLNEMLGMAPLHQGQGEPGGELNEIQNKYIMQKRERFRHARSLTKMRDMGFEDTPELRTVLARHDGNVADTLREVYGDL